MDIKNLNIGFAITGSFCTIDEILLEIENIANKGANIYPILSDIVANYDSRFTNAKQLREKLEKITGNKIIDTIAKAEPIGPKSFLDVLVVAPCTGNTLGKIANAITDTTVTMAVKAHLRNEKPLIISVSTNDGLSANAKNIGLLLNTKNIYFVPFYQDDPDNKARSVLGKSSLIIDTIYMALDKEQIQPIICAK